MAYSFFKGKVDFIGLREILNNENFNSVEFDPLLSEAGKPFDELSDSEKQNLIHLLSGEFLYRLPEKYYKPRFKDNLYKIFKRTK